MSIVSICPLDWVELMPNSISASILAVQPEIPTTDPATATAASAPPPANFHRQYNEQLPERIQNAVAVAEYKSR